MTCPRCNHETYSLKTIIRRGKLVEGCNFCIDIPTSVGQNDIAKYNRDRQREDYAQDIVQPMEGAKYIKARGIDRAREVGFSDEDIRKLY